jgi:hypothetical protein
MNHQEPERDPFSYDLHDHADQDVAALRIPIIDRAEADFGLSWDDAWNIYKVLQAVGRENSFHFARSMLTICSEVKEGARASLHFDDELFFEVWGEVDDALQATTHEWTEERDQLLHFTYVLLRNRFINREHAAAIASKILQQHVTPEGWRKRMERWTHAQGLPPVRRKRGRPPKYNSDTFCLVSSQ